MKENKNIYAILINSLGSVILFFILPQIQGCQQCVCVQDVAIVLKTNKTTRPTVVCWNIFTGLHLPLIFFLKY